MKSTTIPTLLLFGGLAFVIGCGGGSGEKPTASVTGKVTFNGEPVKGGSLNFAPAGGGAEPGKPGTAEIGEDGTYSVSTYGDGDGAVVGPHTVSYSAPSPEAAEAEGGDEGHVAAKPSEYDGLVPKETKVTVESGGSTIDVELVKP